MASQPVHPHTPDAITLRQAEALTGINYQTIYDAATAGHIKCGRYDVVPTFRVSRRDAIKWAANQKAA
jgi:hypothetical protein|nr:MAG TPA: excisionase [Caudoviricetes sp.]